MGLKVTQLLLETEVKQVLSSQFSNRTFMSFSSVFCISADVVKDVRLCQQKAPTSDCCLLRVAGH